MILLVPVDDTAMEGEERFRIRLSEATGGAGLGAPEIEVTIEDDEALRALQFVEPTPRILEGTTATLRSRRPASTRKPIVVRYAIGPVLDPDDGTVRSGRTGRQLGELRWPAGDTSSRTLKIVTGGSRARSRTRRSTSLSGTFRAHCATAPTGRSPALQ